MLNTAIVFQFLILCLVHSFLLEKPSGHANNFPQKGRGLGHVTPKIFRIKSNFANLTDLWISRKLNAYDNFMYYIISVSVPCSLCNMFVVQSESVDLALQILDGAELRGHTVSVEHAKFELKGQYDPTKKRRKLTKQEKKKFREKQDK